MDYVRCPEIPRAIERANPCNNLGRTWLTVYEVPEVKNDMDMRTFASAGNEYGAIEATVDGVKMKNLESYRGFRYFNSSSSEQYL